MVNTILFDNEVREALLPLTYTRPVCELRVGILTIREKWEQELGFSTSFLTQDYLAGKYPIESGEDNFIINGSALPSRQLCSLIRQMEQNQAYLLNEELIAARLSGRQLERLMEDEEIEELRGQDLEQTDFIKINNLWDLVRYNGPALEADFELLTRGRTSAAISSTNTVFRPERIFIEAGARVECSVLNATEGPIYIGKNAEIMEGGLVRGGFAMLEHSQLKMGARVYGATTLGPWSKAGGEINNSIFQAYSNKAHDGFLGNSFVGEWCNIGADTNTSNLKNNYAGVKVWSYGEQRFINSGLQFCGAFLGDHCKTGINTMLNTGSVAGVGANIFGAGFPRPFIPSFSWGGANGFQTNKFDKFIEAAEQMMARRKVYLDTAERLLLMRIFEDTSKYRVWENQSGGH